MVTLMAEVVWRPKSPAKPQPDTPTATARPKGTRSCSRTSLASLPSNMAELLADSAVRDEFEEYLRDEVDGGAMEEGMCGFADIFQFYLMMEEVAVGCQLASLPWRSYFPEDHRSPQGLQLAGEGRAGLDLRRRCREAVTGEGGVGEEGLGSLREAQQVCLNQLTLGEDGQDGVLRQFLNTREKRLRPNKLKKAAMCFLL